MRSQLNAYAAKVAQYDLVLHSGVMLSGCLAPPNLPATTRSSPDTHTHTSNVLANSEYGTGCPSFQLITALMSCSLYLEAAASAPVPTPSICGAVGAVQRLAQR